MVISELLAYGREILGNLAEEEPGALVGRLAVPPLRSALYLPGNRRDFIQKSPRFKPDAVVIDLEDAVHASDRAAARQVVSEEIEPLSQRVRAVWVRVNPDRETLWKDLEAAVRPGLSTVQLSKCFNPESVLELDKALAYFEGKAGLPYGRIAIAPILETANGLRQAYEIAMASRRVEYLGALVAKEGDTARALRMRAQSDAAGSESFAVRSNVLVAARAAGIRTPLGGVVTDLYPDHATLRAYAISNRDLGYAGMFVIHPSHVAVVNEIFSPSADELARAVRILNDLRSSAGRAAIRGPGNAEMVDLAMARFAVLLLEEAGSLGIEPQQS
jgi:citrate lyase subunit beta/citryl-CoA lyase